MPGTKISGLLFGLNRVSSVAYSLYAFRISSPRYISDSLLYCRTIVSLDDIYILQEDITILQENSKTLQIFRTK